MIRRAFFALLLVVTVVKLAIVFSGADYDGDAYAHAMAGRRMLLDPTDVTVHWVWLPLLHCLYSIATLAGSGLTALRVANALIGGASALVLVRILRDHLASAGASPPSISPSAAGAPSSLAGPDSLVPWLAGALLALDPLGLWLGVTGQTEPLFQLLILLGCLACQHRSFVAAGALFAASALTRYEAWPLIPVLFWLALRPETPRSPDGAGQSSPGGAAQC